MKTPKEVYKKSERKYYTDEIEIEYKGRMRSRMVNDRGYFNWQCQRIFVGNPFAGYNVGIKLRTEKAPEVWFDHFKLGVIDFDTLQSDPVMLKSIMINN
jgi:hypothetical protein